MSEEERKIIEDSKKAKLAKENIIITPVSIKKLCRVLNFYIMSSFLQ